MDAFESNSGLRESKSVNKACMQTLQAAMIQARV